MNPAAGKRDATSEIERTLKALPGLDYELYVTRAIGDGARFAREYLAAHPGPVRLYACGGDGTLNEVAGAAAGHPEAAVGCYPSGSGNDFVKYYGGSAPFLDLAALTAGESHPIDLIRVNERYAINACHFGLDSAVADKVSEFRHLPLIGRRLAYPLGIGWAFLFGMRTPCAVTADGKKLHEGDLLLCTLANGTHVGGGFNCAPRSDDADGLLEVCLVRPISRAKFLTMMNTYKSGGHLNDPRFAPYITYLRAASLTLSGEENLAVSLDGEVIRGTRFDIRVLPRALNFIVPAAAAR